MHTVWEETTGVCDQINPDIIHVHALWMPANHIAFCVAQRRHIPVMLSVRGSLDPWALRQKSLKKQLALWFFQQRDLRRAASFHATAAQEADNIRAQGLTQPIWVIPNGVDLPDTLPERDARQERPRIALFLSRLHPGKGLINLVQAWARIRPHGWQMRIVGPDVCGHKAVVQSEIEKSGLQGDFVFVGNLDDQAKWREYVNADLFVHPSHSENFGISIAEALAAGLPVITTKGAPWSELLGTAESAEVLTYGSSKVEEKLLTERVELCIPSCKSCDPVKRTPELPNSRTSRCGWWIDVGADPLMIALQEAFSLTDEERRIMGRVGRKLVEAKYTWSAIGRQMKQAYECMQRR